MSEGLKMSLDDFIKSSKHQKTNRNDRNPQRPQRQQNQNRNYKNFGSKRNNRPFQNKIKGDWEHDLFERNDRDDYPRPSFKTTLRISNLHYGIIEKELNELFSQYGDVKRCHIDWDEIGRSKGTATVEYYEEAAARKAVQEYNGAELDGQKLLIELAENNRVGGPRKIIRKPGGGFNGGGFNRRN